MLTDNTQREHDELLERFKRIQAKFKNARTNGERQTALAEMQKLSDETTALLRARFTEPAQASRASA